MIFYVKCHLDLVSNSFETFGSGLAKVQLWHLDLSGFFDHGIPTTFAKHNRFQPGHVTSFWPSGKLSVCVCACLKIKGGPRKIKP